MSGEIQITRRVPTSACRTTIENIFNLQVFIMKNNSVTCAMICNDQYLDEWRQQQNKKQQGVLRRPP